MPDPPPAGTVGGAMYRFLARPRWLAFHAVVLAAIVGMLAASRWQWHRHQAREDLERRVAERVGAPPVALDELLVAGVEPADVEWRTVTASGHFDDAGEIRIVNRSLDGRAGDHIATPFVLDDGRVLVVNRGWLPIDVEPPPAGDAETTITGRLRQSQRRGTGQLGDPSAGVLDVAQRIDLDRLAPQLGGNVVPMYVELVDPQHVPGTLPEPIPASLGAAPAHLSYTFQWLIFAVCVAIGWVLAVRRSARRLSAGRAPSAADSPPPAADEPATTRR